ncbi:hypothetical protein BpHYR1_028343 [Brachionus plicatilis]|uniref:Uncharacterized protein n=1 Tax=Brachionus plicatilis TaxID=10195 RepID=A0A3M7PAI6_BRAPC|nr:hypothetical protein BpHYR1_028343 [Brachionus plicatilis]
MIFLKIDIVDSFISLSSIKTNQIFEVPHVNNFNNLVSVEVQVDYVNGSDQIVLDLMDRILHFRNLEFYFLVTGLKDIKQEIVN